MKKLTSKEFKSMVINTIDQMPLADLLLTEVDILNDTISDWLTDKSQLEYKYYVAFYDTYPGDKKDLNIDYYIFEIANRIVQNMMTQLLDDAYWAKKFDFKDFEYERCRYIHSAVVDTLVILSDMANVKDFTIRDNLMDDFLFTFEDVVRTYPVIEDCFLDTLKEKYDISRDLQAS